MTHAHPETPKTSLVEEASGTGNDGLVVTVAPFPPPSPPFYSLGLPPDSLTALQSNLQGCILWKLRKLLLAKRC